MYRFVYFLFAPFDILPIRAHIMLCCGHFFSRIERYHVSSIDFDDREMRAYLFYSFQLCILCVYVAFVSTLFVRMHDDSVLFVLQHHFRDWVVLLFARNCIFKCMFSIFWKKKRTLIRHTINNNQHRFFYLDFSRSLLSRPPVNDDWICVN